MILLLGPLINIWAMRFEAKHGYFKSFGKVASFKNICLSLARRHQRKACSVNLDQTLLNDVTEGPSKDLDNDEVPVFAKTLEDKLGISHNDVHSVARSKWIQHYGTKYVPKECLVLIEFASGELPVFAEIQEIYRVNYNDTFFVTSPLETVCFNENLKSYELREVASAQVYIKPTMLVTHESVSIIYCNGKKYVNFKFDATDLAL